MNAKRVERIWRREGLKVPQKQPKRGRLWLNDGSCVRLRPRYRGHVWSYDFVADRTHDGKAFRMLTVIDEHSRECLAIHVQRQLKSDDVLAVLTDLFVKHGHLDNIRVPFLVTHGSNDRQIPIKYAHRSYDQAVNSPDRELKIFTPEEGGIEHCGADNMEPVQNFIGDWLADRFAKMDRA